MFVRFRYLLGWVISVFRCRGELLLENLALRQQLLALHAKRPRPRLSSVDKLFWVVLRKVWFGWKRSLILVTPETVIRWHRAGFRLYWSWISRAGHAVGRKPISREVRELGIDSQGNVWVTNRLGIPLLLHPVSNFSTLLGSEAGKRATCPANRFETQILSCRSMAR
jgi:hypothetical protein